MKGWCVIQIPRTERYQLRCYVPLSNAPLRSCFIAHIRLKTPKTPGVHTCTMINRHRLLNQLNQRNFTNRILPLCRVHPPILHGSAESTLAHKMHDQVDHAGKNPGGNTCSSLHNVIQTSPCSRSISSSVSLVEHMPLKNAEISTRGLTTFLAMTDAMQLGEAVASVCGYHGSSTPKLYGP
jgi:hypothetical protein